MNDVVERPGLADRGGLSRLLAFRELIIALAVRELTVRYRRSLLGVGWALVEPVVLVSVYVVIFGHVLQAGRGIENYVLFTLIGTSAWMFLSTSLEQASSTLLDHAPLIRKIYFPREILVGAVVFSRLTSFLLVIVLACGVAAISVASGSALALSRLPLLPVGVVLLCVMTFGLGLLSSAFNVLLRDTSFLVRFALRIGFYACPVVYPLTLVPDRFRTLYELNPLVGILFFLQAAADPGVPQPGPIGMASAFVVPILCLAVGVFTFRKLRNTVADLL